MWGIAVGRWCGARTRKGEGRAGERQGGTRKPASPNSAGASTTSHSRERRRTRLPPAPPGASGASHSSGVRARPPPSPPSRQSATRAGGRSRRRRALPGPSPPDASGTAPAALSSCSCVSGCSRRPGSSPPRTRSEAGPPGSRTAGRRLLRTPRAVSPPRPVRGRGAAGRRAPAPRAAPRTWFAAPPRPPRATPRGLPQTALRAGAAGWCPSPVRSGVAHREGGRGRGSGAGLRAQGFRRMVSGALTERAQRGDERWA